MGRFGWITRKFVIFRLFKKCESAYFSKQMCYGVRSTSVVHVLRTCYTPKIRNGRYINPIGVIWLNIAWGYVRKGLGMVWNENGAIRMDNEKVSFFKVDQEICVGVLQAYYS